MSLIPGFLLMVAAAAASALLFWFVQAHWAHALGFAPYILFLICPLIHLFMHKGHGGHSHERMPPRD